MFELSRPAVSEHLRVLRHAGLVREEPRGQQRFYHLEPLPLVEVEEWLHPFERFWRERMRDLQRVLDQEEGGDLMTEPGIVTCEQFLMHPPDAVWRALTEPDPLAKWWATGDVRPVVGHRFTVDMGNWGTQSSVVTAVDPGRLFAYTFGEGSIDTTIAWRLAPEGKGTRLFLEHSGFDLESPIGRQAHNGMGGGRPAVLQRIDKALDERVAH